MKLQQRVLLATVPLMLMMGGTLALAQTNQQAQLFAQLPQNPETDGTRPDRGMRGMRWIEELDLSTEQSEQIQSIQEQAQTAAEGLHQQIQQAHEELHSLMASDTSADQLRQQHQQVQNLKQQLDDQRFETMLQVREVLTAEQRAQLAEIRPQRRGHHQGPGSSMGPGPQ